MSKISPQERLLLDGLVQLATCHPESEACRSVATCVRCPVERACQFKDEVAREILKAWGKCR